MDKEIINFIGVILTLCLLLKLVAICCSFRRRLRFFGINYYARSRTYDAFVLHSEEPRVYTTLMSARHRVNKSGERSGSVQATQVQHGVQDGRGAVCYPPPANVHPPQAVRA